MSPPDHWLLLLGLLLLVLGLGVLRGMRWRHPQAAPAAARGRAGRTRSPRPHTPAACPCCRQGSATLAPPAPAAAVRPWCTVKSRRGAPKRVSTDGYACTNPACPYLGVTDAAVHALVADGHHGRDRIQDFRCQACGCRFSARRDTPLYHVKTPGARVAEVLGALAEGVDVAAASRIFGHSRGTITRWLTRAGAHAQLLHDRAFRHLHLPHVQLDELRTRLRRQGAALWLWLAVDACSKTIPVLHLGARTQTAAHTLVHDLRHRLAPGCLPVFTSDGLRHYYGALTAHFGRWAAGGGRRRRQWQVDPGLLYARVQKRYQRRRLVRVVPRLCCGSWAAFRAALQRLGLRGTVNTAFVERTHLTARQGVAGLARRTWSTAQTTAGLLAHLEWWRAYFHFCRPHAGLRVRLGRPAPRGGRRAPRQWRPRTPAMAAGLTHRRWTVQELLSMPLPPRWCPVPQG
jgi:IS1 family transposase/transposase-like protein